MSLFLPWVRKRSAVRLSTTPITLHHKVSRYSYATESRHGWRENFRDFISRALLRLPREKHREKPRPSRTTAADKSIQTVKRCAGNDIGIPMLTIILCRTSLISALQLASCAITSRPPNLCTNTPHAFSAAVCPNSSQEPVYMAAYLLVDHGYGVSAPRLQ